MLSPKHSTETTREVRQWMSRGVAALAVTVGAAVWLLLSPTPAQAACNAQSIGRACTPQVDCALVQSGLHAWMDFDSDGSPTAIDRPKLVFRSGNASNCIDTSGIARGCNMVTEGQNGAKPDDCDGQFDLDADGSVLSPDASQAAPMFGTGNCGTNCRPLPWTVTLVGSPEVTIDTPMQLKLVDFFGDGISGITLIVRINATTSTTTGSANFSAR